MMRTHPRVRGLQDIMSSERNGPQNRLGIFNLLAQLHREKERITQEKQNWQNKIDSIDARLAQIETRETQLRQLLTDKDQAFDGAVNQKNVRKVPGDHTTAPEVPVTKVTIRY